MLARLRNALAVRNAWDTLGLSPGDLLVVGDDNEVRALPVGATNGHVLTVDNTQAYGIKWAASGGGGGGGGDNVTINTVAVVDIDLDDATPAAPAGDLNVKWQKDASSPANVSGYVDVSVLEPLLSHANLASGSRVWTASGHTGTASKLAGFDGAGAAAYYTIGTDVQAYDAGLASFTGVDTAADRYGYTTAANVWASGTITAFGRSLLDDADAAAGRTTLGVVIGADVQAYDADLAALAALASTGLIARTGAGTVAARTLTGPAAGITVTNGDGVSGNPTLALANDLAGLEGLSGTGYAKRTGTDTWTTVDPATVAAVTDVQTFTTTGAGTWTKPTTFTPTFVRVQMWGAGGGGGGGSSLTGAAVRCGGSGGGGGAYKEFVVLASTLGATVAVSVGAGGTAGAAGASGAAGGSGGIGGNTQWDTAAANPVTAFGGGGGRLGANSGTAGGGGGGGGTGGAGAVGSATAGGVPGLPATASTNRGVGGGGGLGGFNATNGDSAEFGGGGGGGHTAAAVQGGGGGSLWGGGGGGCGGSSTAVPAVTSPSAGGASGAYAGLTGGAAGASGAAPTAGTAGAAGTGPYGGGGGGGGGSTVTANTNGAAGGAGGARGGGGGGGGSGTQTGTGGAGGVGGRGEIIVTCW